MLLHVDPFPPVRVPVRGPHYVYVIVTGVGNSRIEKDAVSRETAVTPESFGMNRTSDDTRTM